MNHRLRYPKFTQKYSFLGIYEPRETLNDPSFHFYTEPQPGFHRVSLHRKLAKKPLTMYYEQIEQENKYQMQQNHQADNSTVIDFEYFSTRDNAAAENVVVDRSKIVRDSEWVKKYEPSKFIELLTDDRINRNLLTWLKAWDPIVFNKQPTKKNGTAPLMFNRNLNNKQKGYGDANYFDAIFNNPKKLILLAGPPGCGKTTLVRVLANHGKYNIVQINASDDRSANNLISKIQDIASNDTIRGNKKPALICLDEIDGMAEGETNGISKILDFLQNGKKSKTQQTKNAKQTTKGIKQKTKPTQQNKNKNQKPNNIKQKNNTPQSTRLNRPVIFICNDPFAKSIKQLRNKAHVVYFSELNSEKVVKRMREVLEKEKIYIELPVLQKISEICKNDIRSCIGILELVAREKKVNNKNPKDIINRMKLSFTRDNQSSINQFLLQLFTKSIQHNLDLKYSSPNSSMSYIKYIETQVMQIYNPALIMETFLQNFLNIPGITRKSKAFLNLYHDLIQSDVLMKNGFKYQNQLQNYHAMPYIGFSFNFGSEDIRKVEFPNAFFERLRKQKWNKEILKQIYSNIPIQLRTYIKKQSLVGSYLLALYLGMQSASPKESQIIRCVSLMLTYDFTLKKQKEKQSANSPIFNPQIDTLLTFGSKRPQILISNVIKALMEQNYQFFKERKQMLTDNQLRDNTTAMINQIHLNSRKKRNHDVIQGLKYRFVEGTGTKTSYNLTISYFF